MQKQKIKLSALIWVMLLTTLFVQGQTGCSTNLYDFAPYNANEFPVTTIRVSFDIICNPSDTFASLRARNAGHAAFLHAIIDQLNVFEANNDKVSEDFAGKFVSDTRLRYVLEGIHNWDNTTLWNDGQADPTNVFDEFTVLGTNPLYASQSTIYQNNTLHVLLVQTSCTTCGTGADPILPTTNPCIEISNNPLGQFNDWNTDPKSIGVHNVFYTIKTTNEVLHESGHMGGLQHVGDPGNGQYRSDWEFDATLGYNCPNLAKYVKTTNDRMDYYPTADHAITDWQLGNLYGCIYGRNPWLNSHGLITPIFDFVVPAWKDPVLAGTTPMTIATGVVSTWLSPRYLDRDIIIQNGATLAIKCYVAMPPGAKIEVQKGGHLIVDGGHITCEANTDMWRGIVVDGDITRQQEDDFDGNPLQGWLSIINGATIELARSAVWVGEPGAGMGGGIVELRNSIILNCAEGVKFDAYTSPGPFNHDKNKSVIENSTFTSNVILPGRTRGTWDFITMWEVQGVVIAGNTFQNTASNGIFSASDRGTGIFSINASYEVRPWDNKRSIDITLPCNHPTNTDGNHFINLSTGISILDFEENRHESINENTFTDCWMGIYAEGTMGLKADRNTFTWSPTMKTDMTSQNMYGISTKKSPGFMISENTFNYGWTGYVGTVAMPYTLSWTGIINSLSNNIVVGPPANALIYNNAMSNLSNINSGYVFAIPPTGCSVGQFFDDDNSNVYLQGNQYYSLCADWVGDGNAKLPIMKSQHGTVGDDPNNTWSTCGGSNYSIDWNSSTPLVYTSVGPLSPCNTGTGLISPATPLVGLAATVGLTYCEVYGNSWLKTPDEMIMPTKKPKHDEATNINQDEVRNLLNNQALDFGADKSALLKEVNQEGVSGFRAKAVLGLRDGKFVNNITNKEYYCLDNTNVATSQSESKNFSLSPNPGSSIFQATYILDPSVTIAELSICDVKGIEIKHIHLDGNCGQKQVNMEGLAPGTYQCTLQANSKLVATQKLVLIR